MGKFDLNFSKNITQQLFNMHKGWINKSTFCDVLFFCEKNIYEVQCVILSSKYRPVKQNKKKK